MVTRRLLAFVVLFSLLAATQPSAGPSGGANHTLPARISDADFWRLVTEFSEGDGYFPSDNLVSNELTFQWVIPRIVTSWTAGQAYLCVCPDQNFTYLAALKPSIALVVDIRRDNLRLQLLYKALIEMSPTRAAFLSRLLSRESPAGVPTNASVGELFAAFGRVAPTEQRFADTLVAVRERLTTQHGFVLSVADLAHIE